MRAPAFWWRAAGWKAAALEPAAALFGAVAARRLRQRGERAGLPVVCVGNPTVGGAGKTPTALRVAAMLAKAGERPAFLTRGYGGRLAGPVEVQVGRHGAKDVGDEPLLLARAFPTVVARERAAGARAARASGASVVVMDDGFQNPSLEKDCSVLVVDGERGLGNGAVFPAGPLRAPLAAQLDRCHAVLVIGAGAGGASAAAASTRGIPVFTGRLLPEPEAVAALQGRPALAFAGIGHPEKFFATLAQAGIAVAARRPFPDHHRYSSRDAASLVAEAEAAGWQLVTTEKDLARLSGEPALEPLRARSRALPVHLVVDDESAFEQVVLGRLSESASRGSGRENGATSRPPA